jgi:hypothetical protein
MQDKLKVLEKLLSEIKREITVEDLKALDDILRDNMSDSDDILVPYFTTVKGLFTNRTFKGQPKRQIEDVIGYLEPGEIVYAYVCKRHEGKDVTEKDIIWLPVDSVEYARRDTYYTMKMYLEDMSQADKNRERTRDMLISLSVASLYPTSKK